MRNHRLLKSYIFFIFIMLFFQFCMGTPAVLAQRADANVLAANAAIAYDDERYDEALNLLDQAIVLDPQHERSLFYQGLVYLALKKPEKAIEPLETVHQLRPDDLDIQHHLGVAHFAVGDYDKAYPYMEAVFEHNPDTENMGYYVGFLRYRDKQYGKAVEAFDRNQTPSADIQQLNGFYRGLALGVLGLPNEALSELEQVQRTQTISPLTQSSIRIREALSSGQLFSGQKRLRLQISAGGFYDDNVKINPDPVQPIPVLNPPNNPNTVINSLRSRDTTAPGFLTSLRADYSFLRQGPFEATATYSFFQTLNGEGFDEFNIQDHLVGLSGFYRGVLADIPFQLGIQYSYDYLFLDMNGFLSRHTPTASATVILPTFTLPGIGTVGNLTTALYRYQVQTFFREVGDNDVRFQGEVRDGYNNTLGFVHAFRLASDKLILRIGYQYDNESTEGAAFSYSGNRLLTGGQLQLPWGNMTLRYDYDVHWRAYKNNQVTPAFTDRDGFLSQRYDIQQTHFVQLTKPLPNNFAITAQYQGIRNQSEIPLYDYTKNSWTMVLTWTY
jgi:tetratricopeptide (TPR) repeat protein